MAGGQGLNASQDGVDSHAVPFFHDLAVDYAEFSTGYGRKDIDDAIAAQEPFSLHAPGKGIVPIPVFGAAG